MYDLNDVKRFADKALMKQPLDWHLVAPLYQDIRRGYHDIRHIHTLINQIHSHDLSADAKRWLEAVAWLHDMYYNPLSGSPLNEALSASALDTSLGLAFTDFGKGLARETILLTAEHLTTHRTINPLQALFLDIDIMHLGADYTTFVRNSQLMSLEYRNWGVADSVLIEGYHDFFSKMLARQQLYYTQMYAPFEQQARQNLTQALQESAALVASPQMCILQFPSVLEEEEEE